MVRKKQQPDLEGSFVLHDEKHQNHFALDLVLERQHGSHNLSYRYDDDAQTNEDAGSLEGSFVLHFEEEHDKRGQFSSNSYGLERQQGSFNLSYRCDDEDEEDVDKQKHDEGDDLEGSFNSIGSRHSSLERQQGSFNLSYQCDDEVDDVKEATEEADDLKSTGQSHVEIAWKPPIMAESPQERGTEQEPTSERVSRLPDTGGKKDALPSPRKLRQAKLPNKTASSGSKSPTRRVLRPLSKTSSTDSTANNGSNNEGKFLKKVMLPLRTHSSSSSKQRRQKSSATNTHFNIFGSKLMVTTDFILDQLDQVLKEKYIVTLELEDCLGRNTEHADKIPLQLRRVLQDERPWERLQFVDELRLSVAMNGTSMNPRERYRIGDSMDARETYQAFRYCKKRFQKHLGGICHERVIPVHYHLKVTLQDDINASTAMPSTTEENNSNENLMIALLRDFQLDPSIRTLTVHTQYASIELLQALTALLQCDKRNWQSVTLRLSSISNPGTKEWQKAMHAATEELQLVAASRGIQME